MMVMMRDFEAFDEEVTIRIPVETMQQLVFGEGHAASGPDRPTRNLSPVLEFEAADTSDGIPVAIENDATTEPRPAP